MPPRPSATGFALLVSDVAALSLASFLAVGLVALFHGPMPGIEQGRGLWLEALGLVGYASLGLYPATGLGPVDEMRRLVLATTALFLAMLSFVWVGPFGAGSMRDVVVVAWPLSVVLVPGLRAVVRHVCARRSWWGTPAVVVGSGATADGIVSRLDTNPGLGLKVVARLDDASDVPLPDVRSAIVRLRHEKAVSYAIVAMPGMSPARLDGMVRELGTVLSNIVVIPAAFGHTSVGISTRDSGGIVGLHVRGHASLRRNRILKRLLDLGLLTLLGPPALVIVLIAAVAVMIVSPGHPFYSQVREGYKGRPIRVWKLRTMRRDADAVLNAYLAANSEARDEWSTHFKLTHDPRVIPGIGRFLRRSSLDELPQIANVLTGSMSFVGPRPFPYYHLDQFDPSFRDLRSSVVPGVTGWWQVMSRSTADLVQQVELDSFYIHNWSLWLDLYILARTPWAVLLGSGAH
jgi:Undecaprenyl-phosphate galactose phosphotransferase WbaP